MSLSCSALSETNGLIVTRPRIYIPRRRLTDQPPVAHRHDPWRRLVAWRMASERHHALDFLRGLAALAIAIYHWLTWNAGIELPSIGAFGVYIFFCLSSLTMMIVYGHVFDERIERAKLVAFARNRAARLLPLLAAVAMGWLAVSFREFGFSVAAILRAILTGTGLMALSTPGFTSFATGTWSLGIELQFYVVLPTLVLFVSKASIRTLIVAIACLVAGQQIYLLLLDPIPPASEWHYYVAPITFAPFFMAGFVIFRLGGKRFAGALPLSLFALTGLALFSVLWPIPIRVAGAPFLTLSFVAMAAVYFANRATVPAALVPGAVLLGDLSYAVYLTHPFTNIATNIAMKLVGIDGQLRLFVFIPATLAIAAAVYFSFERPLRDRLRSRPRQDTLATLP